MIRQILAVLVGMVAGGLAVFLIQQISVALYPMPEGLTPEDSQRFEAYVASLPLPAFLILLVSFTVGTLVGGLIAARISRTSPWRSAIIVGTFFLLATIGDLVAFPHPSWFAVASLLLVIGSMLLAGKLARVVRPMPRSQEAIADPVGS